VAARTATTTEARNDGAPTVATSFGASCAPGSAASVQRASEHWHPYMAAASSSINGVMQELSSG